MKKYALRRLVRGKDGRLKVAYVDSNTGKPVGNLNSYELVTAGNTADLNTSTKDSENKDKDKPKDKEEEKEAYRGDSSMSSHPQGPGPGVRNEPTRTSGSTTSPGLSETQKTNTGGTYDKQESDENGSTTKGPSDTNLGYSGNYSSLEGKNLNELSKVGTTPASYTPAQKEDMARTLAGEIDPRQTDLSTPAGQQEAYGIMSTMQNRDDVTPGDISAAIHQDKQYSTWNDPKAAEVANANYAKNKEAYDAAVESYVSTPTNRTEYTHYYNPTIAGPKWGKDMKDPTQIGPHLFGTLPEYAPPTTQLTPNEVDTLATGMINENVQNSFATPAGQQMAQSAPDVDTSGISHDGWGADYGGGVNFGGALANGNPNSGTGQGMSIDGDSRAADGINNAAGGGWAASAGNSIAGSPPSIGGNTPTGGFANHTGVGSLGPTGQADSMRSGSMDGRMGTSVGNNATSPSGTGVSGGIGGYGIGGSTSSSSPASGGYGTGNKGNNGRMGSV